MSYVFLLLYQPRFITLRHCNLISYLFYIKLLWNRHCSWGINVRGFRGSPLSMYLHPKELVDRHLFNFSKKISRTLEQREYVPTSKSRFIIIISSRYIVPICVLSLFPLIILQPNLSNFVVL